MYDEQRDSARWSGAVGAVAWTYDHDFRVATKAVRNAFSVSFGCDQEGLLMSAGDPTFTRFAPTGVLTCSTVGSTATTFGYTGFGELTSHATTIAGTPTYSVDPRPTDRRVKAVNKANGNPATRYVHRKMGQSVVIDDVTGDVVHVGGAGFRYGPGSGDIQ